ncbi:hypothetical protein IFM89_005121 [Coptis chinensis]|uniref:Uncharacterized protein n=1 Tax=Coptis chinensis TaxID=261450 RepID=A0A835IM95_9MAGN|nr:hypothetical protein IFM89_005121 [Coptis chinensis]
MSWPTVLNGMLQLSIHMLHKVELFKLNLIKLRVKEKNLKAKSEGDNSLKRKDYMRALFSYTEAIAADPSDATALSSRSCCFACIGDGSNAWADAKACTRLRPDWPEAHYRAGVALGLLEKFDMAADSFLLGVKLDPKDNDLRDAFRFSSYKFIFILFIV